ncbi:M56 family metallopeptidase [Patiriisocius hiemis]|uniref:M56 family metallopeptidase n=1 Tax=Patiriisocius hiemis TaxID=3075604 RepID=A0ABU2YDT9_9FLAO|nr:M56 family metallopeptidase [Constantimarinum sp. W242]MDT0556354.1 M56 family metallopeptidase [Constantimarinum sp. W242]
MIHYILQIIAFQLVFLLVYDIFLKKETFFNWNRLYLLVTPILSFVLPLIKIDAIRQQIPENYIVQLPAVIIGEKTNEVLVNTNNVSNSFSFEIIHLWYLGITITGTILLVKLIRLYLLKQRGVTKIIEGHEIILLPKTDVAFTFFNTIFIGETLTPTQQKTIIAHELIHVQQYHSIDLLFFEILRIIFWFNPLVYVYQNRTAVLQEYIADAEVTKAKNKKDYYQSLLSQVFDTSVVSFTNTFFKHSLIKNRIIMIQKSKSKKIFQLKYLLLVPLVFGMLVYTSCSDDKTGVSEEANQVSSSDTEIMTKINELSEAIMKKGNLTDEEKRALDFLATEAKPGDKVYTSVDEYLEETESIPFAVIEKVPVYPGCDTSQENQELKKCMTDAITKHIIENFNTKVEKDISGRQRISVQFKIDKSGNVKDVKARAAHPELENEAVRVVSLLPKMKPGEQKGKKVTVVYALPIVFEINE